MIENAQSFSTSLGTMFPDLGRILADHFREHGELLPHLFMADVTRYILAEGKDRQRIVQYLEDNFKENEADVENLIGVSFIENLETKDELELALRGVKGDGMRQVWHQMYDS